MQHHCNATDICGTFWLRFIKHALAEIASPLVEPVFQAYSGMLRDVHCALMLTGLVRRAHAPALCMHHAALHEGRGHMPL